MDLSPEFPLYLLIGFVAQVIDGALGMAYGVAASAMLLGAGLPPAAASATVHAAECFTTGASAFSHRAFGNIDRRLFLRLLLPGMAGAAIGAWLLGRVDADAIRPWVAGYLALVGVVLLRRALARIEPRAVREHVGPLGFAGGLLDAIGGGGWGPIVTSHLLARGAPFRFTVGSVSAVEFFVTLTASLVFLLTVGLGHWDVILALAIGGAAAAPLGSWLVRHVPARPMLALVGLLVVLLGLRTLWKALA